MPENIAQGRLMMTRIQSHSSERRLSAVHSLLVQIHEGLLTRIR
jgi:hypothetical protein